MAPGAWVRLLAVGGAFCVFFHHFLWTQILISRDPDWSHAYLIPLISAYYIYEHRRRIFAIPARVNWLGLPVVLVGAAAYFIFTFGATTNHSAQGAAMVLTLLGLVLLLLGAALWKALLFPMLYLSLGVRAPERWLLQITPTLQVWASEGSYFLLNALQIETELTGTVLTISHDGGSIPLNVAEACSGMRMIVAFIALGVAMAFLTCRAWWQRGVLIVLGVPVAIFVNVLRVASLGVASIFNPDLARGDTHILIGTLWLVPALLIYMALAWVVRNLFVPDPEAARADGSACVDGKAPEAGDGPQGGGEARAGSRGAARLAPVAAAALLLGGLAFPPLQKALGVYLRKEPVPLRSALSALPRQVGQWKAVGGDEVISAELVDEFGTDEYLTRHYAREGDPSTGLLQLHIAYYTGSIDPVPHIPDRCYVGGGLVRSATTTHLRLTIDDALWWPDPASMIESEDAAVRSRYRMALTTGAARQAVRMPRLGESGLRLNAAEYWAPQAPEATIAAGYLFIANGGATASPEGVRLLAYDRSSRFAYYCKVQLTYQHPARSVDRHELGEVASEFLSVLLPDLMACLPDWWEVEQGRWPAGAATSEPGK